MSLLTSLNPYLEEIKLGAIVIGAGALFAGGYHLGGLGPKSDLAALQAADWQSKYQASQVALTTVQGQLAQEQKTSANNSTVIQGLTDANAKTAADRDHNADLYQRLLNRPGPAHGAQVSASPGGQAASSTSGTVSGDPAPGLLADATAECKRNADRLDALSAQIIPQL